MLSNADDRFGGPGVFPPPGVWDNVVEEEGSRNVAGVDTLTVVDEGGAGAGVRKFGMVDRVLVDGVEGGTAARYDEDCGMMNRGTDARVAEGGNA